MFKRRKSLGFLAKTREWVYPRSGWRRALEYIGHRIKRLPDTPHKIALGFSCGVFVSFSPLFGFHFIYAGVCAWIVRGNILAAFIGTLVGNPVTFPLMATTSLTAGYWLLGVEAEAAGFRAIMDRFGEAVGALWQAVRAPFGGGPADLSGLGAFWSEVFLPYYVGGIFPGLLVAAVFYFATRPLVEAYQTRRRARQVASAKRRLLQTKAGGISKSSP
ncbi:MAG: DUF2062 domain-containing protein [Pseudomonadota bacterium]